MARALGVQIRTNRQVITGSVSAEPQLRKTMETPHVSIVAPTAVRTATGNITRFKFSPLLRTATDTTYDPRVDITYACVCLSLIHI